MTRIPSALAAVLSAWLLAGCSGPFVGQNSVYPSPPATAAAPATQQRISVDVGHCFVAPVQFRGQEWLVPLALNYGGSGGQFFDHYPNWSGRGAIRLIEPTHALYEDDGGSHIRFRPSAVLSKSESQLARSCD